MASNCKQTADLFFSWGNTLLHFAVLKNDHPDSLFNIQHYQYGSSEELVKFLLKEMKQKMPSREKPPWEIPHNNMNESQIELAKELDKLNISGDERLVYDLNKNDFSRPLTTVHVLRVFSCKFLN